MYFVHIVLVYTFPQLSTHKLLFFHPKSRRKLSNSNVKLNLYSVLIAIPNSLKFIICTICTLLDKISLNRL